MKDFNDLTEQGKARRLRRLALNALDAYDLEVASMTLLAMDTNTLFRVRTPERKSYVLRVCAPGWRTDTDLQSEVLWLQALARDTELGAPVPVLARDGRALVMAETAGVIPCRCMMMSWIPGVPLGKSLTEANLENMGKLHARMHIYSAGFTPPEGFTTRRLSSYLSRGEPEALFDESNAHAMTPEIRSLLLEVRERVEQMLADLYADPTEMRVIHDDLWHDNIHLHRGYPNGCGGLRPLDFEDTAWGYPIQDLAAAFKDLRHTLAEASGPAEAALRRGYERVAPWPERFPGEIDLHVAGMLLWVANYVARFENEYLRGFLERLSPALRTLLARANPKPLPA